MRAKETPTSISDIFVGTRDISVMFISPQHTKQHFSANLHMIQTTTLYHQHTDWSQQTDFLCTYRSQNALKVVSGRQSTQTTTGGGGRTPPCLTPHNTTKCAQTELFHKTDAVILVYQLRRNRTKSTETFRSKSFRDGFDQLSLHRRVSVNRSDHPCTDRC